MGFLVNFSAILLLFSAPRLSSVFNSMLTSLLVLHTLYLVNNMTIVARSALLDETSLVLDTLFVKFLYPFKPTLLYTTTFLTVGMARERYKAIRHPLEYRYSKG